MARPRPREASRDATCLAALSAVALAVAALALSSGAEPVRDANATTPESVRATPVPSAPVAPATAPVRAVPRSTAPPGLWRGARTPYPALFDLGGCSGALVRWPASRGDDAALVLTAGHCVGRSGDPHATISGAPGRQEHPVTLLDAGGGALRPATVAGVEFAGSAADGSVDLGLLRLTATFTDLEERYGARPRTLAVDGGTAGTTVRVLSGSWREETTCRQTNRSGTPGPRTAVTFETGSRAEPCAGIRPGWSGSPVVRVSDDRVVAVDSVGVHAGGRQLWNAGPPAALLLPCLDADRRVRLDTPGCDLG